MSVRSSNPGTGRQASGSNSSETIVSPVTDFSSRCGDVLAYDPRGRGRGSRRHRGLARCSGSAARPTGQPPDCGGLAFFEGFSDAELERVAELAENVEAEAGALLIDQGRVGTECYVIEVGYAGVWVGDEHLVTLGPGSMVGEMALIERTPRSASVVAETPVRLLAFDNRSFQELLHEMPKAEERVKTLLAARLKANTPLD